MRFGALDPWNLASAFVLVIGLAACGATRVPAPPPPAQEEEQRWIQDARYALEVLEALHPELDHAVPIERFEGELDALERDAQPLERRDVFFALMGMVALAQDAHTRLADWDEIGDLRLPMTVGAWSDGFIVEAVGEGGAALFGRRIVGVGGQDLDEVVRTLRPLVPHENERVLERGVAALLSYPRALVHVGLAQDVRSARIEFEDEDGARETLEVGARPAPELRVQSFFAPPGWRAPLWRRDPYRTWWWQELEEGSTLYLQYNRCLRSLDDPFEDTAHALLERIDAGGIERIVIDLRLNSGGDSAVLRPLIEGLRKRQYGDDRVIVAIGPVTFSSGMLNAYQLQRELGALLVGEPTSQKPDCFGEVRRVELPNTGWRLDCSTKRFRLFGDDRPWLEPEVHIELRFADLLAGHDPVLAWLEAHPPRTR